MTLSELKKLLSNDVIVLSYSFDSMIETKYYNFEDKEWKVLSIVSAKDNVIEVICWFDNIEELIKE